MKFKIYRYNPENDPKPFEQEYELTDIEPGTMLLAALLRIKDEQDETLSFRRSCGEGVCGSDGMNINGVNGLACITSLDDLKQPVEVKPLPGLPVIRDLIIDMDQFYKQYRAVEPYLVVKDPMLSLFLINSFKRSVMKVSSKRVQNLRVFCIKPQKKEKLVLLTVSLGRSSSLK